MTGGELSVFRHDSLHYGRQALEEIERLQEALRNAVRLMDEARSHYGIEECSGPGQPATEWDDIQGAMGLFAEQWRDYA